MRYLFPAAALLAAVTVSAQHASSEGVIGSGDPRFAAARATIQRVMDAEKLPSVSVAVVKDGQIIWQEAFGFANRERQIRATPSTAYSLASISKPITATGLMRLVEQEKVDLDKPANEYLAAGPKRSGLPERSGLQARGELTAPGGGDASGATVRRVMSHTAGLPLHYQFFYAGLPYSEPPADETIARYGVLVNPPGAVYQYSNLGYGILDQIIERTSGKPYAEYMRDEVFRPLGMRQSSVHVAGRKPAEYAERYDADGKPIPYYDFDHDGGSAVYASAIDLAKFGAFHLRAPRYGGQVHLGATLPEQRRVIGDDTRALMQTPQTPPAGEQYGLGWFIGEERGVKRIWHTGSMPGVTTILNLYPDEKIVTVVLLNTSNAVGRTQIAQAIAAAVLRPRVPSAEPRASGPGPRGAFIPGADQLGEWAGVLRTWEREIPLTMRVEQDGDVKIRLGAAPLWTLLNQVSWRDGHLTGRFIGRIPTPDAGRHPHTVSLDLYLRDGKLAGQATALTTDQPVYFALTSYATLTKR